MKNVAVALALLAFPNKSSHNQQTGGVPLPFVHLGTIILSFTHKTNGFLMVLGCPKGTPAGKYMGPSGYLAVRGCPTSRVHSTNPKDLGPEDPYPKGSLWKDGKREDGKIRLVSAPGGPRGAGGFVCA